MKNRLKITSTFLHNNLPLIIISATIYIILIILANYLNIWEDEFYSLITSSSSLKYAIHQSIYFEAQPPAYFLLLTVWRVISDSILWARLLNFVLILIAQILLYQFANKLFDRKIAIFSSILFLLNPTTIFTLLEIRLFALVLLLSLIILIMFYKSYYNNKITARSRFFYILFAILGLFTQYFFGFLLFANAIVLILQRKRKSFWIYFLDMLIPLCFLLLYIPQILISLKVQTGLVLPYSESFGYSLIESIKVLFDRVLVYVIPLNFSTLKVWLIRVLIAIMLLYSLNYTGIKKDRSKLLPFIIMVIVICLFFILMHYQFGPPYSAYKYTTILFIPLLILLGYVFRNLKLKVLNLALILYAVLLFTYNFKHYRELYKINDYRSVGRFLENNEKKEEPAFVFRSISAEILDIYYEGINKIYPLPKAISYNKEFSPEQWNINNQDIDELQNILLKYSEFYIIIVDDKYIFGFNESKNKLMEFLESNFKMIGEKSFNAEIKLYEFSKISKYQN